jgi:hypothetical protein
MHTPRITQYAVYLKKTNEGQLYLRKHENHMPYNYYVELFGVTSFVCKTTSGSK